MSCYNDYTNFLVFSRYCPCFLIASEQQVKAVYPDLQVSAWSCIYVWYTSEVDPQIYIATDAQDQTQFFNDNKKMF
jgi:hypothetical protein